MAVTQEIIMGKWKLEILWVISQKTRRFSELQRLMPKVARGVLTRQLRELESDMLVHREVYRQVPPKVEYSLTETGESFVPVMKHIMEWGVRYIREVKDRDMDVCMSDRLLCSRCQEARNGIE